MNTDAYRRVGIDRPGVAGPSSVGLGGPGATAGVRVRPDDELQRSEARFALSLLAGSLGGVYVAAGLTLLGRLSEMGIALVAIGLLQGAWAGASRRGWRRACGRLRRGGKAPAATAGAWSAAARRA